MTELNNIKLRTQITAIKYDLDISYKSNLMFIGSCFTENIGEKLKSAKFNVDINPFGVLYNPISVKNSLGFLINKKVFKEDDIFYFNERWNSYFHHGRFALPDKDETLEIINNQIIKSSEALQNSDILFITFGTAWVYELAKTQQIVSNCHKVPAKEFNKRLIDIDEIIEAYSALLNVLKKFNNKLKVVFTISPVRHLKDGFSENNLSKSVLKLAIDKLVNANSNCYYFPAYEIMMDDLRDYRFFSSDLLHPNETAIDYIFNYFGSSFFSDETLKLNDKINKILQAKQHKPFNPKSNEYMKFVEKNISDIKELCNLYNYLNLKDEFSFFIDASNIRKL